MDEGERISRTRAEAAPSRLDVRKSVTTQSEALRRRTQRITDAALFLQFGPPSPMLDMQASLYLWRQAPNFEATGISRECAAGSWSFHSNGLSVKSLLKSRSGILWMSSILERNALCIYFVAGWRSFQALTYCAVFGLDSFHFGGSGLFAIIRSAVATVRSTRAMLS